MVAPIYDLTGFYIGANGGWGQAHNCWDFLTVTGAIVRDGCTDASGGVFGGQIGYRWQAASRVFGLEAQGDWADLKRTRLSLIDPTLSTTSKIDAFGLFTGSNRLRLERSAVVRQGRRGRDGQSLYRVRHGDRHRSGLIKLNPLGRHPRCWFGVWLRSELVGGLRVRPPLYG